jgi:hypothetical protein
VPPLQHTNVENRVLDIRPPEGPCVPEMYPYPTNHSCYKYVPVGHYKCECRMDYTVEQEGTVLANGYKVCDLRMICLAPMAYATAKCCVSFQLAALTDVLTLCVADLTGRSVQRLRMDELPMPPIDRLHYCGRNVSLGTLRGLLQAKEVAQRRYIPAKESMKSIIV